MPDVTVPVIDFYLHPPLGVLAATPDYLSPYSGNETITQWAATPGPTYSMRNVSASYGVVLQLAGTIPAGYGYETGWVSPDAQYDEATYWQRLCQVIVQHQMIGGLWVTTQRVDVHSWPTTLLWETALPGRLGLLVAPGLAFDLMFLVIGV